VRARTLSLTGFLAPALNQRIHHWAAVLQSEQKQDAPRGI